MTNKTTLLTAALLSLATSFAAAQGYSTDQIGYPAAGPATSPPVVYGHASTIEEGAMVRDRQTILRLPDLSKMQVKVISPQPATTT